MPSHADALHRLSKLALRLRGPLLLAATLTYGLSLPLFLAYHLNAEGPILILVLWIGLTLGGLYAGEAFPRIGRHFRTCSRVLAVLGVGLVLLQLNVVRRSLAEAWLEIVREGRALGFFSFFAAQLAAIFSTLSAYLVLRRGLLPGTIALLASASLIHGILYAFPWTLCLAVLLGLQALVFSGGREPGKSWRGLWRRFGQLLPPFLTATALSLPVAFLPNMGIEGALLPMVDMTPLVIRAAPALPLLLDVPGYGYGVGASRLSSSVYLTEAPLFSARGIPGETLYLGFAVFRGWTGSGWLEDPTPGREVPIIEAGAAPEGARLLSLTLEAELYDRIPLPPRTEAAHFPHGHPELEAADDLRGLRFTLGAVRGLAVDIHYRGTEDGGQRAERDDAFLDPGPDPGGRIKSLAESLRPAAVGQDALARRWAEGILGYLRTGFQYSLHTSGGDEGTAMDRFLFQDRRGYCLHFAGAAVLLARHAGIPARLVEGFRLSLDATGRGLVRGVDSHAWGEFFLDGTWVMVEATPPFASEDPFQFTLPGDRASRRQLAAIFGSPEPGAKGPGEDRGPVEGALGLLRWMLAIGGLVVALGSAIFGLRLLDGGYRLRRRASALVRRGRRKGVQGPEILGWTVWAQRMGSEEAKTAAAALLRATFDPAAGSRARQGEALPQRPMSRRKPMPSKWIKPRAR